MLVMNAYRFRTVDTSAYRPYTNENKACELHQKYSRLYVDNNNMYLEKPSENTVECISNPQKSISNTDMFFNVQNDAYCVNYCLSEDTHYLKDKTTNKQYFLGKKLFQFQIGNRYLYYMEKKSENENILWRYDFSEKAAEKLLEGNISYVMGDEEIYVCRLEGEKNSAITITRYTEDTMEENVVYHGWNFPWLPRLALMHEYLIFWFDSAGPVCILNLADNEMQELLPNDDAVFRICITEDYLFVSTWRMVLLKPHDIKSLGIDSTYERHGVWRWSFQTKKWKRIDTEFYYDLYAFDHASVWGIDYWTNKLYQISVDGSGTVRYR